MESSPQSGEVTHGLQKTGFEAANDSMFTVTHSGTGEKAPGFTYDDAKFMITSGEAKESDPQQEQVLEQKPHEESHVLREPEHLETVQNPTQGTLVLRGKVHRPSIFGQKSRALAAAALVGIGGAATVDTAQAKSPFEQQAEVIFKRAAVNIGNQVADRVVPGFPVRGAVTNQGVVVPVEVSPSARAMNRPVQYEPGVEEYATSIGIQLFDDGNNFSILNINNHNDAGQKTIKRVVSPTRYVVNITVKRNSSGGIIITDNFMIDGGPHTETLLVSMGKDRNLQTVVIGK